MQTIGERLEEARKKKGISIREAAEATKIRGDYLQKFEGNHFDIGLTEIYTRGFLRSYSNYLKLPADRILNDYAALGRGDARPRQPSREVYGRMDISVATTEAGDRTPPPTEPAPEPSHANRGPARPRTGSSLPTGPDPAVVFKYVKIGGAVVIVIMLFFVVKALFTGRKPSPSPTPAPAVATRGPTFGLVALSPLQVTVRKKNSDGSDGEFLFSGQVTPGDTKIVSRPGAVYIEVMAPGATENLLIEVNGRRVPMGLPPGERRGELPAP
ncbi:helix-turn-helix domain-containing protein [Horticoccus sp. 23ND18S-11]|uniref:helix-turn-helix domain-containing protein n=1 Tax=Horticoccus sp. 23ND18S-11 TaxID=3391832 RepID=UPI0039C99897